MHFEGLPSVLNFDLHNFLKGATTSEIKKQYRKLSLKYHPDKETGDPVLFMRIAKAYEAYVHILKFYWLYTATRCPDL